MVSVFHRSILAAALAIGIPNVRNGQGKRFVLPIDREFKDRQVARNRAAKAAEMETIAKAEEKRARKNARRIALAAAGVAREPSDGV